MESNPFATHDRAVVRAAALQLDGEIVRAVWQELCDETRRLGGQFEAVFSALETLPVGETFTAHTFFARNWLGGGVAPVLRLAARRKLIVRVGTRRVRGRRLILWKKVA